MPAQHLKDGQHRHAPLQLNRFVFISSAVSIVVFALLTIIFPAEIGFFLDWSQNLIASMLSWYYMLLVVASMGVVLWLCFSRYGHIKLGQEGEKPEFSYIAWVTMLFSAGIGIAVVYFGAYEPLDHYLNPPAGAGGTAQAAQQAMVITFLHWGLHGWALYALGATVLAYYAYVEKRPLALRTALYPIFGKKLTNGLLGDMVDGFGILATVIAMVTNLGIGAMLVYAGLVNFWGLPEDFTIFITLIIVMMGVATIVAVIGIEKGIALLSKFNLLLLCLLLVFVFLAGPTFVILDGIVQNTGDYLSSFVKMSFNLYIFEGDRAVKWRGIWTVFYWAWWIAWAPFVSMFIARISKGRTIRELVSGVLLIPLGFTLLWLAVFGNAALHMVFVEGAKELGAAVVADPQMAIYHFLQQLPWSKITIFLAIVISFVLFLAPVDSGSLMISNLALRTDDPDVESPIWMRIFWCVVTTAVTVGLFFSDNFMAIQQAVVLCGLPFSLVIVVYMISLIKSLRQRPD
ncbi:MAG: Choline/carnitine/betaine family transporter [Candidatus Tokpelaia hoelldobleri]|uniref:Choline/carnitine/betaine family transporter n=1 Tax=Candidatus Tokpelaia hoelldobleri TaxID=1902579 RepID=A0A1U9JSL6_9HYPH|nr:MAG: Choline/carnitine/betaine family transporter [Candidatus Tokpelaia hoelldoblerii]